MKSVCLGLLCYISSLCCELIDHLKVCENKECQLSIEGIDFIYVINLDHRCKKWQEINSALNAYNITPYRFSAVNGRTLGYDAFDECGVKVESWMSSKSPLTHFYDGELNQVSTFSPGGIYYCDDMKKPNIGCALSHISILQDAWDSGYETVWILEDDAHVLMNPHAFTDLIKELDQITGATGWDILYTDIHSVNRLNGERFIWSAAPSKPNFTPKNPSQFFMDKEIHPHFRHVGGRYGLYSFIIRRQGIRKLLDHLYTTKVFYPIDIEYGFPNDMQLYSLTYDLVTHRIGVGTDSAKED